MIVLALSPQDIEVVRALQRLRRPTRSAQLPSRADLTRRQSVLVVSTAAPRYPLVPVGRIKYFAIVRRRSLALVPHPFSTTSSSGRLDSSSVCLGWNRCCTPLPPLRARRCTSGTFVSSSDTAEVWSLEVYIRCVFFKSCKQHLTRVCSSPLGLLFYTATFLSPCQVLRRRHPTPFAQPSSSSGLDPLSIPLSWIRCCTATPSAPAVVAPSVLYVWYVFLLM